MNEDQPTPDGISFVEIAHIGAQSQRLRGTERRTRISSPWSYEKKRGRVPIRLTYVEYRIFKLLSSKPYHAFSTKRIVEEVNTERFPVTEESLRQHIVSLRRKLGFFSDYIQTVPFVGYRFKA